MKVIDDDDDKNLAIISALESSTKLYEMAYTPEVTHS